ncbi:Adaptor for signal transduction [Mortierella alpina]|nr:Adaptor for signal transduction [Mortierella alpina]
MAATVKAWHRDDCRRLSIDIEQIQYQELKKKSTFQLENEFTVKYADMDGDLCTISGTEEFEDLINSDLVKERKGTLRLQVIPKGASRRPSILHRRESSDQSVGETKTTRPTFDNEYTDCDMLEILRDISLFICARGMDRHGEHENALAELPPGASSWVSAGKNLITPTSAQNFQRLNYARVVRAKFPVSNSAALLNGLDGHVYNWTVETTGQWLLNNGYEDTVQCFKDNDITGDVLLDLTHDTLKDMGIHSTGRRIRLLKMIAELRLHVADLTIQEATDEAQAQELEGLAIH